MRTPASSSCRTIRLVGDGPVADAIRTRLGGPHAATLGRPLDVVCGSMSNLLLRGHGSDLLWIGAPTPQEARQLQSVLSGSGHRLLIVVLTQAPGPNCLALAAGDKSLFDQVRSLIESVSGAVMYLGPDSGTPSAMLAAEHYNAAACLTLAHEAVALARHFEMDIPLLLSALNRGTGGNAATRILADEAALQHSPVPVLETMAKSLEEAGLSFSEPLVSALSRAAGMERKAC